jgi:hypothetical protein
MNTTDERLRAAARTAVDMFPPGGDLPPLRLPGPADRRRHLPLMIAGREARGGTGRVRAWLAPLAAAAAVTAVIAALVVPQQILGKSAKPKPARKQVSAQSSGSPRRPSHALDVLVIEAVAPATGPQYDRGTKLIWMVHAQELPAQARCMAASGYNISSQPAPFNLSDYADNTQMPDLPRIARTHEFVPAEGVQETHFSKAEQKVFNACGTASQEIGMSLLRAADKLSNAWWRLVSRLQASREVQAAIPALSACATRYGFPANQYGPADAPIKTFSDFMNWVAGYLDGAGSRGASARTLQALSRHWTAVFVTCATPIVGRWQRLQLAAQPNFLRVHASQVRQLDELAWRLFGHQGS